MAETVRIDRLAFSEDVELSSKTITPSNGAPSEMIWLLAEIGMVLTKLENLIEASSRLTLDIPSTA